MAILVGRTNARNLINVINNALIAEGYEMIASHVPADGYVYRSRGVAGDEEWYMAITDPGTNVLNVMVCDKYTPGAPGTAGTFGTLQINEQIAIWATTGSGDVQVNYFINVNKNRIIIHTEGAQSVSNRRSGLFYVGLPIRYSPNDKGPTSAGWTGSSVAANANTWEAVAGRNKQRMTYELAWYDLPTPYAWGDQYLYMPIYIGHDDEGPRGELDGLYLIKRPAPELVSPFDTFKKNGKTYILLPNDNRYSTSGLPDGWFVVEAQEGLDYAVLLR